MSAVHATTPAGDGPKQTTCKNENMGYLITKYNNEESVENFVPLSEL